jgi:hypothetical protein
MGLNRDIHNRAQPEWISMTKAEYDRWQAGSGRNLTDSPLGGTSGNKRTQDALASQVVTETLGGLFGVNPSTTPCPEVCNCDFCFTKRTRENARVRARAKYYRNKARIERTRA